MHNLFQSKAIAAIVLLFPVAMFADQTATLSADQTLNFDTGATGTSGGDIQYRETSLTLQGSATAFSIGAAGQAEYDSLDQQAVTALGTQTNQLPISAVANDVFVVHTNGGHYGKVLITAVSGSSITLEFTTYGSSGGSSGGGGTSGPTISAVQNNYSNIVAGLPNYGIAPGALFVIYGSGLADPAAKAELQSSASPGIPTTLNGAQVFVNGSTTLAGIYYATATQIAAVLPSSTPTGTATITVKYNGTTSAQFNVQVVTSALGLDTLYGTGTGLGVATEGATVLNYNQSAKPGDTITLWGSGLGATTDSDTVFTSPPAQVNVPLQIYIGGIQAAISYQGGSGYPGLNQINVTVPQPVQPGCAVSLVAVTGSVVSNIVTIPVASNGGTCSDPVLGIDGDRILSLGSKTTYNLASLGVVQSNSASESDSLASAIFMRYSGSQSGSGYGLVSLGSCIVNTATNGSSSPFSFTGLDAGAITVTGPDGTPQALPALTFGGLTGTYEAQLPGSFMPAGGGTYTFNATGGKDIGAFHASIEYDSPLDWTNRNSITSINRSQGLNLTWTGGPAGSYVIISGGSASASGASASFICFAAASAQQFTIPAYILSALPSGSGDLSMLNDVNPGFFSAPGLDKGVIFAGVSFGITPSYQ